MGSVLARKPIFHLQFMANICIMYKMYPLEELKENINNMYSLVYCEDQTILFVIQISCTTLHEASLHYCEGGSEESFMLY